MHADGTVRQSQPGTVPRILPCNNSLGPVANAASMRQIIHNPGTLPDSQLVLNTTSITVVFEQSYDHYKTSQESRLSAVADTTDRDSWAYIFHSVQQMGNSSMDSFVREISHQAAYLYATTRSTEYYEHFDTRLEEFCDAVPT